MSENLGNVKKDVTTKVLVILLSLMLIAVCVLGFLLYDLSQQNKMIVIKTQELGLEKDRLKTQLTELYDDYADLETNNDSLNAAINKDKEYIQTLIKELDRVKNYNYSIQQKYEKELGTLRSIMRHYVFQIDSLDQLNKQLIAENTTIKDDHKRIKHEMDNVVERNDELELVIEGASVLKTTPLVVKFLNKRNKETRKTSKVEKLQISFTIVSNNLASAGPRRVYLRIVRPDGYALSSGQSFDFGDKKISFSASRDIIYEKENLDVSIYYEVSETLTQGKYLVEIYADNQKIGDGSFQIEK